MAKVEQKWCSRKFERVQGKKMTEVTWDLGHLLGDTLPTPTRALELPQLLFWQLTPEMVQTETCEDLNHRKFIANSSPSVTVAVEQKLRWQNTLRW
jgi:hypothetical protein